MANSSNKFNRNSLPPSSSSKSAVWTPPSVGYLKANVDAALFPDMNKTSYGFILRDADSNIIDSGVGIYHGLLDVCSAEALGVRETLRRLQRHGVTNAILETDSSIVCAAISDSYTGVAPYHLVVDDCKHILWSLANVQVCHVHRSANMVAHTIARAAVSMFEHCFWSSQPPQFVLAALAAERS